MFNIFYKLAISVYDIFSPGKPILLASSTFPLFNERHMLQQGEHKIKLFAKQPPDVQIPSATNGIISTNVETDHFQKIDVAINELATYGDHWLNTVTFNSVNRLNQMRAASQVSFQESEMYIFLQLPNAFVPILHSDAQVKAPPLSKSSLQQQHVSFKYSLESKMMQFNDGEAIHDQENPVELKHRNFENSPSHFVDPNSKPSKLSETKLLKVCKKHYEYFLHCVENLQLSTLVYLVIQRKGFAHQIQTSHFQSGTRFTDKICQGY